MSVLSTGLAKTSAGGYDIDNSLRFNKSDSAYLNNSFGTATNKKKWTYSIWVKGNDTSSNCQLLRSWTNDDNFTQITIQQTNYWKFDFFHRVSNVRICQLTTTQLIRDPSAWYHFVIKYDSTPSSPSSSDISIYINGVQVTDFSQETYPSQNTETHINNSQNHVIMKSEETGGSGHTYGGAYLAEVHFIDGQALDHTSFGETGDYGEWKPIEVTGMTYGTNGFYLDFSNSGSLGTDASSNTNNWTVNNLAATDQMLDSPTNNFACMNPLSDSSATLSQGNLQNQYGGGNYYCPATFQLPKTGKWYWEVHITALHSNGNCYGRLGITYEDSNSKTINDGYGYGVYNSGLHMLTSTGVYSTGLTDNVGDIIQFAVDMDNGKFYIGQDDTYYNTSSPYGDGNPSAGTNPSATGIDTTLDWRPDFNVGHHSSYDTKFHANFGQDSSFAGNKTAQGNQDSGGVGDFYYTPPTGFLALCTSNLPAVAVVPSEHFNTVLYTGNATADHAVTVGYQPDFVWLKNRIDGHSHRLIDAVRGDNKVYYSNSTDAEEVITGTGDDFNFTSTGFTLPASDASINANNKNYVAWNWKAGNATLGTGSFTQGTIASTCSRNVDAGFSIVSYTGTGSAANVGHGLSVAPEFVVVKKRNSSGTSWVVLSMHAAASSPEDYYGKLEQSDSFTDHATIEFWGNTAPTATVFYLGDHTWNNASTDTYIAYCFHSVDGYSKVGSYTGNGSGNGTFIYTGFHVAYVLTKRADASDHWQIFDNKINIDNAAGQFFRPHSSAGEDGVNDIDLLSNGFKLRNTNPAMNASGGTYLYIAFAESPFKHTNAR